MDAFRTAFRFGGYALPWNAVVLVVAVAAAVIVSSLLVKRRGMYRDLALDVCILCIPAGLLGGRLFAALSGRIAWGDFFSFGQLGVNLFGALLFCAVGTWVYCRIRKFSFGEAADVLTLGMLLLFALGRWQDFFLCDGLGYTVENPALKWFPLATFTEAYFTDGQTVAFAVFFYEFIVCLLLFVLAWRVFLRRNLRPGDTFALSLLLYGAAAYALEFLRDPAYRQVLFSDVTFNGLCSALLMLGAFGYLLFSGHLKTLGHALRTPRPMENLTLAPEPAEAPMPETEAETTPDEPISADAEPESSKEENPQDQPAADESAASEPASEAETNPEV